MAKKYSLDEIGNIINTEAEKVRPGDSEFKKILQAIAFSESSGDPTLPGDYDKKTGQYNSWGLFQNNRKSGRGIGHSIEDLKDPVYNTRLAIEELVKYYDRGIVAGKRGAELAEYVSKHGQRPAPGNEKNVYKNYGVVIGGGNNKINLPGQTLGVTNESPTSLETQLPKDNVNSDTELLEVQRSYPGVNVFRDKYGVINIGGKPGPRELTNREKTINDKVFTTNQAKMSEEMRRWKKEDESNKIIPPWFRGVTNLFSPKPVFSAEKDALDTAIGNFLDTNTITNPYGARNESLYGKSTHKGTDYRASENSNVYGVDGWKVLDTYRGAETGNNVVIVNPKTGETIKFSHLNKALVKRGDTISGRTPIALSGNTGSSTTGAHLHVEYTDSNGNTQDVTKLAQKTQAKKQPSIVDNFNSVFTPKPVMAAESSPTSTPKKEEFIPPYSQKGWEQSQAKTFEDRARAGEYYGKSQGSYQIKPGDTLSALAKSYKTTVNDFVRANPTITNPNVIRAGATINVPSAPTPGKSGDYVVRSGDNLTTIARNLGTTVNDIVRKNNIVNPNLIYTGTKLKV